MIFRRSWMRGTRPTPARLRIMAAYQAFLTEIGYLVPEPAPFTIGTRNVDAEIAHDGGPQLVVPSLNDRFVLNAANARWGSLYDALYGTDVLDAPAARPGGYDTARGDAVIAYARAFLNAAIPGWEAAVAGAEHPALVARREGGLLFAHNGLHIEIVIDPDHPVGRTDALGIADVVLEAALTTIIDLEDSVAAVDAEDKVAAYSNWLGLMRGDLTARFDKAGKTMTRALDGDRLVGRTHFARPQPDVRAQCRPFDDQPGGAAGRWVGSARRHSRCAVHVALRLA
jgi:malate synthase